MDATRPLYLGLTRIEDEYGLEGHSDADVVAHAIADALLGAADLGDLGVYFSDRDEQWRGVASRVILVETVRLVAEAGFRCVNADVTVIAERPRLAPWRDQMRAALSEVVGAPVSVKATTHEGLGAIGRAEGIAAHAVVLIGETT
jgi:2-C-methyl-D-erythritol 2,4-cyclodiphosphate synthase